MKVIKVQLRTGLLALILIFSLGCRAGVVAPPATSLPTHPPATITLEASATHPPASDAPLPSDTPNPSPTEQPSATFAPTLTPAVSPTPAPPPNVILLVIDSLRADHVSAYGYHRPTTPNLDQIMAAQGVRFETAITPASWTCPANAALMSGLMPSTLNSTWKTNTNALPSRANTLAEYLQEAGYYTAGFVNNACVQGKFGFEQGFHVFDDALVKRPNIHNSNNVRADEMNSRALHWLEETWSGSWRTEQPLFLFVYYMEPHSWYNPPPPFDTLYDTDYTGMVTAEQFGTGEPAMTGKIAPDARDNQHLQALYDGDIASWDEQFKPFMDALEALGVLENALVIVTADHGESFNEHGSWTHGTSLYQEEIRVPLLMRYSGRIAPGSVIESPVQSYDLMPTILDYAGLPIPADIQALSLRPLIEDPGLTIHRNIYSEVDAMPDPGHWAHWQAPADDLRSIQQDGWKFIYHIGNPAADELYLLADQSPYENENWLLANPEQAQEMRTRIEAWFGLK